MTVPDGVCTPIISMSRRFHGDVGETNVAYGPCLGMESLSGSPSPSIYWRRSLRVRLVGRTGEDTGCSPFRLPLGGEEGGAAALILARVGTCADELRLKDTTGGVRCLPTWVRQVGLKVPSPGNHREHS
jgi:hypothetical protein